MREVSVNERGLRIGEGHPKSDLTDAEVEAIRELNGGGMSYGQLAKKFDQSKGTIAKICRYERRADTTARHRKVLTDSSEYEEVRKLHAQGVGWKAIAERLGVDRIPYRWRFWCKLGCQGFAD